MVGLGIEHWIECLGCSGYDILGALVNQVRKEASEANHRVVRETMYGEGDYGGLGFGYIKTGNESRHLVASEESVANMSTPRRDSNIWWSKHSTRESAV